MLQLLVVTLINDKRLMCFMLVFWTQKSAKNFTTLYLRYFNDQFKNCPKHVGYSKSSFEFGLWCCY